MDSSQIGPAIRTIVEGGETTMDIVPEIEYANVSNNTSEEYITYHITGTRPTNVKDSASRVDEVDFDIRIFGTVQNNLLPLAANVRTDLDRYKGTVKGVKFNRISFVDQSTDYDPETRRYMIEQSYTARVIDG